MFGPFLILALLAGTDPGPMEPKYKFETKGTNSVVAQVEKDRTVFVITSERGIGWADITVVKGNWPEAVTLRFRLAEGRAFTALEGITLTTDTIVAVGAIKGTDIEKREMVMRMRFAFLGAKSKPSSSDLTDDTEAGLLHIRVKRQAGGLELTLPARMLRGASRLHLGWTDWYRR